MIFARFVVGMVSLGIVALSVEMVFGQPTSTGSGQAFPNKPIRIVASTPGGSGDISTRQIAPGLSERLGQPVIIDNRGGTLGDIVAKAPADGYTLLVDASGFWLSPIIQKMSYDPVRDFSPITMLTAAPNIVVVHPSMAVNSVKELIALAKAKPGALNYGSAGVGSSPHLAAELLKSMAGVNIVHVPYKGAGLAVIDLIGGQIQLMIASAPSSVPHIKSGKLKALAVTTAGPSLVAPGIPSVSDTGLPGYEFIGMLGLWAPAKTPAATIERLNQEIVRVLRVTEVKERLLSSGVEAVGNSSQEFDAKLRSEIPKWSKVIREAGIKAD